MALLWEVTRGYIKPLSPHSHPLLPVHHDVDSSSPPCVPTAKTPCQITELDPMTEAMSQRNLPTLSHLSPAFGQGGGGGIFNTKGLVIQDCHHKRLL